MKNVKFFTNGIAVLCGVAMLTSNGLAGEYKKDKKNMRVEKTVRKEKREHKDFATGKDKRMSKHERRAKQSRKVSGMVISKKEVKLPAEKFSNLVVLLKTNKGNDRLIVDLGNAKNLEKFKIDKKTDIKVEGRLSKVGKHEIFVARQLKIGDQVVDIDRSLARADFEKRRKKGS